MCRDKSLKKIIGWTSKCEWNSRWILKFALNNGYTLFTGIEK